MHYRVDLRMKEGKASDNYFILSGYYDVICILDGNYGY